MIGGDSKLKKVLVVGGAGFIGSHMVKRLLQSEFTVVTFDNLSSGYRDAVMGGEFILGDLDDRELLEQVFAKNEFSAVFHFASSIQVGESVSNPSMYYLNNVGNTLNLLDVMVRHDVRAFIFSSSAAIFGEPEYLPIDEDHPRSPLSPYGRSKYIVEQVLEDYDVAYGLKSACLRYFNAAGADPEGALGERHKPETHLIPLVLEAAAGLRPDITVFGDDYDTPDGTCIRDYVHVEDLCTAHFLALQRIADTGNSLALNLGGGFGFSVKQIIMAAREITGKEIKVIYTGRRYGDPARLVADSDFAKKILDWQPRYNDVEDMIRHAWNFLINQSGRNNESNKQHM